MAVPGRTLNQNLAIRVAATPGPWAAAAVFGPWVQIAGLYRRALLAVVNGELDADMLVEVFEAQDGSGTGAAELTSVTTGKTFTNGSHEGKLGLIEIRDSDLHSGFTHIAVRCTPGAADTFAGFWILSDAYDYPVDNGTTDGVVFNVGE
jgi:hypothetical protein